jgi:hypothetical protein
VAARSSRRPFFLIFQHSRRRPDSPCAKPRQAGHFARLPRALAESLAGAPKRSRGDRLPDRPAIFGILKFFCWFARGQEGRPMNFSKNNKGISSIAQSCENNFTTEYAGIWRSALDSTTRAFRDNTFPHVKAPATPILQNVRGIDI